MPIPSTQSLQDAPLVTVYGAACNKWDESKKYKVVSILDKQMGDHLKTTTGKTLQEVNTDVINEIAKVDAVVAPVTGHHIRRVEELVNANESAIKGFLKSNNLNLLSNETSSEDVPDAGEISDHSDEEAPTTPTRKPRKARRSVYHSIKREVINPVKVILGMKSKTRKPFGEAPPAIAELLAQAKEVYEEFPGNRCAKYLIPYLESAPKIFETNKYAYHNFYNCIKTGLVNRDSGLGCYAMAPKDYETYADFFDAVIGDYHTGNAESDAVHESSWDLAGNDYDIGFLTGGDVSMRVRVGRNLSAYNLPGAMNKAERIRFETNAVLPALNALVNLFGGNIYSLSPDLGEGVTNDNLVTQEQYDELVQEHIMFKDMDADPYLKTAGISSDWPYGRGCWQSEDRKSIIWYGEEDQFRIMCMFQGTKLSGPFTELKELLDTMEAQDGVKFAVSPRYGAVTSCPSNLGTGMRASVHIKVPNLTRDGTDAKVKAIAAGFGLSVRGTGGEHTPIGADGTIDLSPSNRLFIKESEIVARLNEGIAQIMAEEKAAAGWLW